MKNPKFEGKTDDSSAPTLYSRFYAIVEYPHPTAFPRINLGDFGIITYLAKKTIGKLYMNIISSSYYKSGIF